MKIELDHFDDHECCTAIREKLFCGDCSASTMLVWNKSDFGERPKGTSLVTVVTDDEDSDASCCYLVRCSFFKFNVSDPDDIRYCEGFKNKHHLK